MEEPMSLTWGTRSRGLPRGGRTQESRLLTSAGSELAAETQ